MTPVKQHLDNLGVSNEVIHVDGQAYCVVCGTGERHYGLGGGEAAFAYESDDASDVRIESYQDFCDTFTPVEATELAKELALLGYRLTTAGQCDPVLNDAEYAKHRRGCGA